MTTSVNENWKLKFNFKRKLFPLIGYYYLFLNVHFVGCHYKWNFPKYKLNFSLQYNVIIIANNLKHPMSSNNVLWIFLIKQTLSFPSPLPSFKCFQQQIHFPSNNCIISFSIYVSTGFLFCCTFYSFGGWVSIFL